jgi:hypothetical protein
MVIIFMWIILVSRVCGRWTFYKAIKHKTSQSLSEGETYD